jgi:hypothetical protein
MLSWFEVLAADDLARFSLQDDVASFLDASQFGGSAQDLVAPCFAVETK